MITNRFLPQTQRSHSEKKMVAWANRTTKDNLCSLIKENNSSVNHWCHNLGETACKKTHNHSQNTNIGKMLYEVVFGISRKKEIKKPQMSGQVTATSHAE